MAKQKKLTQEDMIAQEGFELHEREYNQDRVYTKEPAVTVNKSGSTFFNRGSMEAYGIPNYRYIKLYFDKTNRRVGMLLLDKREQGAYTISRNKKVHVFNARNFYRKNNTDLSEAKKGIPLNRCEKTGLLVFNI